MRARLLTVNAVVQEKFEMDFLIVVYIDDRVA